MYVDHIPRLTKEAVMIDWKLAAGLTVIGAWLSWSWIDGRKRAKSMTALADRLGLGMWGHLLPPELSLAGTPIANASAKWNVMEGKRNGIPDRI